MLSNACAIRLRNFAAQLDRRVSDAFAAVQNVGLEDGARGTRVETSRAGAAAIGNWRVIFKIETCQNTAEEQPRTGLLINDAGILSEPANSGILGVNALEQRSRIHICLRALR